VLAVEHGSFTPIIMSSTGGMGDPMSIAVKHLARKLSEKQGEEYSKVMGLLRCRLGFSMMRSAIVCLRGSRTLFKQDFEHIPEDNLDIPATIVAQEIRYLNFYFVAWYLLTKLCYSLFIRRVILVGTGASIPLIGVFNFVVLLVFFWWLFRFVFFPFAGIIVSPVQWSRPLYVNNFWTEKCITKLCCFGYYVC